MSDIKVQIISLTYNQEKWITVTLQALLSQETDFNYEILIGDDASTDGTVSILEQYQKKYPDKIKVFTSANNMGVEANYLRLYEQVTAPYVAICDGDDIWVDSKKLQKQVDFLELHTDYGLVTTRHNKLYSEDNSIVPVLATYSETYKIYTQYELILNNPFTSSTALFRSTLLNDFLAFAKSKAPLLDNFMDYTLWLYFSSKSKVAELRDITTHYRISTQSISQNNDYHKSWQYRRRNYLHFKVMNDHLYATPQNIKHKAVYNRAKWYYLLAAYNKDTLIYREFSDILLRHYDLPRYIIGAIVFYIPSSIHFAEAYEKILVRIQKIIKKH